MITKPGTKWLEKESFLPRRLYGQSSIHEKNAENTKAEVPGTQCASAADFEPPLSVRRCPVALLVRALGLRSSQIRPALIFSILLAGLGTARAAVSSPQRFKSPSGKFEVIFQPVTEKVARLYEAQPADAGLKPKYLLYFYKTGSSEPISTDWYTDADPPKPPADIVSSMLWSPQEDYVVIRHGQNSKEPAPGQWVITVENLSESHFEGDHVQWVDRDRMISDLNTKKIPGGIQCVDARRHKADLILPPDTGIGYAIAAVSGHRVTVKEFLNHWNEEHEKTSWEVFDPVCFDLDLDSMKKRSVPCPAAR